MQSFLFCVLQCIISQSRAVPIGITYYTLANFYLRLFFNFGKISILDPGKIECNQAVAKLNKALNE